LRDAGGARALAFVDTGGGFGVDYAGDRDPASPRPPDFVRAVRQELCALRLDDLALYVEPGRSLVAAHGVLLARVIQHKVTPLARWLMIDAGMNDLMRPALYQAKHRIVPLRRAPVRADGQGSAEGGASTVGAPELAWRVVGPVCESSDDFGQHPLPADPPADVAILDAGAYGYTMANRYNGRQLPVEVFTREGRVVASTARTSVDRWVEERLQAGP
ncbi:MAG: hypothetical protein JOZ69_03645, partial [Myxococcales bacterium]|nr:hypothetical protein [Myxococcales bacterium]